MWAGGYYYYFNHSNHRYTNTREPSHPVLWIQSLKIYHLLTRQLKNVSKLVSRVSPGKKAESLFIVARQQFAIIFSLNSNSISAK
jgi:hypothetical protein